VSIVSSVERRRLSGCRQFGYVGENMEWERYEYVIGKLNEVDSSGSKISWKNVVTSYLCTIARFDLVRHQSCFIALLPPPVVFVPGVVLHLRSSEALLRRRR
jgi:hypothetical protein